MILTAKQAFKTSQKGAIRKKKKNEKIDAKEFRLVMKKIRQVARQGGTNIRLNIISNSSKDKLNELGYKTEWLYLGVDISWESAGTSVTGPRREVSA